MKKEIYFIFALFIFFNNGFGEDACPVNHKKTFSSSSCMIASEWNGNLSFRGQTVRINPSPAQRYEIQWRHQKTGDEKTESLTGSQVPHFLNEIKEKNGMLIRIEGIASFLPEKIR